MEHGPIEIVDFPSYIAWWFSSSLCGQVYQAEYPPVSSAGCLENPRGQAVEVSRTFANIIGYCFGWGFSPVASRK